MESQAQPNKTSVWHFVLSKIWRWMGIGLLQMGLLLLYHAQFVSLFHIARPIGKDYMIMLPQLLAGYVWFSRNGWADVPWFTPTICGGIPYHANPVGIYYSVPQWLTFAWSPMTAVWASVLGFAWTGWLGTYLFMRRRWDCQPAVASVCATLFMFNGMYFYRMVIGHLIFQPMMLLPWLCLAICPSWKRQDKADSPWDIIWMSLLGGACIGYMFHGAMFHLFLPFALSVAILWLTRALLGASAAEWKSVAWRVMWTCLIALGLMASKLYASFAFLSQFPRNQYTLPGTKTLSDGLELLLQSLFWSGTSHAQEVLTHNMWELRKHEFEFSLSLVPVLVLLVWLGYTLWKRRKEAAQEVAHVPAPFSLQRAVWWGILVLLLCLPWWVNTYQTQWNQLLKSIPIIKSSSSLFRWYGAYLIPIIVWVGLAMRAMLQNKRKAVQWGICAAAMGIALLQFGLQDQSYYRSPETSYFQPIPIESAYHNWRHGGHIPAIRLNAHRISLRLPRGRLQLDKNDTFIFGASQLQCVEAMFGYKLEFLPKKTLQRGPVTRLEGGVFNMKNPACYVFPKANGCAPGDHFKAQERSKLEQFRNYRPFAFVRPWQQHLADIWTMATLCGMLLLLLAGGWIAWRKRRTG